MRGNIRKRGDTWSYSFFMGTVDGKKKYKTKGGFIEKKEAEKALRKAIKEFEDGITVEVNNISFADYLDYWYKNYVMTNLKYRSQERYSNEIKNHIKPYLGNYRLQSVNHLLIQEFLTSLANKEMAKTSIRGIYGVLAKSINDAYQNDMLKSNPLLKVHLPKVSKKEEIKPLNPEQLKTIINHFHDTHYFLPIMIGICVAPRVGEACGLTWDNIDFDNNLITINKMLQLQEGKWVYEYPKTDASFHIVEVPKFLIDLLKEELIKQDMNKEKYGEHYINEEPFTNAIIRRENGQPITPETMKWLSHVINKKLNIPYKFHWLRHTKVSVLMDENVPIKEVQATVGHSDTKTTLDTYGHLIRHDQKRSVEAMEKLLNKIMTFS